MCKTLSVRHRNELRAELSREVPESGIITVGNDASATVKLGDNSVAPEQFVLVCEPDQITLMCRAEGTRINDKPAAQGSIHRLETADIITVADYSFTLGNLETKVESVVEPKIESSEIHNTRAERTLTDVLKSLRAEDNFYFQIGENQRLIVEKDICFVGKTSDGEIILTEDESEIVAPSVQIRKDWSGVVVYPLASGKIWLGDKFLAEPHRLKNDEILYLPAFDPTKPDKTTPIKFCEPTALLALDSILPKPIPPPISLTETAKTDIDLADNDLSQPPPRPRRARLYFGYFTLFEILIMIVGTLITAAVIFLILEFY